MTTAATTSNDTTNGFAVSRKTGATAGLIAGPLFLSIVLVLTLVEQSTLQRYGWTFTHSNDVPWPSGLSLGAVGVIQVLNFAVTGLLVLVFTVAFADVLPKTLTARIAVGILAVLGLSLVTSAFPTDTSAMRGNSPDTWHGYIHEVSFVFLVLSSALAPVFVGLALRRDRRWRSIARFSFVVPFLLFAAFALQSSIGDLAFALTLAIAFGWIALLAQRLRHA